jgi:two-component system, OmpR family, sensor kinase
MTLRLRMVVGLVLLVLTGLTIFGFSTYALYARSQYQRLDDQLRATVPLARAELLEQAGLGPGPGGGGNATASAPFGTYAVLGDPAGTFAITGTRGEFPNKPDLPAIADPGASGQLFTTGSVEGRGKWRVSISRAGPGGNLVLQVAIPTKEVQESLHRLIVIEAATGGGLLVLLAVGSWFILRRGLRPLEQMATETRSITAGDLSRRVEPSDGVTEVGQLGLALNTMLGELEDAFKERDATEQKLRQFLADASHELRTPLTSIQGFAELFRLGEGHPDLDLPIVMRRIEQESARMKVLVDDLLLLARLDQPRPIEKSSVDLAVLAADACSDAHAIAPDRCVTLDASEPVVINGDRDHLRQAIANLVTNAVVHTPAGTAIDVSARRVDGGGAVAVRDHGAGLDATALRHVFDRFWQADPARTGAGSGLGLAIVESIAREHGGNASAANAVDGGAVFTLWLPAAAN